MEKQMEFYLDLHKNELRGWEKQKSGLVVGAMIEGIKFGHKFSAVNVVRNCDVYELEWCISGEGIDLCYGGHHRALAHYIEDIPLRCNLLNGHKYGSDERELFPIRDIVFMVEDKHLERVVYHNHLDAALLRLPLDVVRTFCRDNNLNEDDYLWGRRGYKKE